MGNSKKNIDLEKLKASKKEKEELVKPNKIVKK